jgi:hypothetical protein
LVSPFFFSFALVDRVRGLIVLPMLFTEHCHQDLSSIFVQ